MRESDGGGKDDDNNDSGADSRDVPVQFLKFANSMIPTISYDYIIDIPTTPFEPPSSATGRHTMPATVDGAIEALAGHRYCLRMLSIMRTDRYE
eukprot:CAMPEP_0181114632 /NCGR_PEP_ID=MMETSP1071-20121207/20998_1 /TAXON_ID=35127 /ORGANISM="Thalassiosira sp., Strain NH16" /LENGTH=93 /DNA_ID=CAMNT_0023198777 /DNA_START=363 /DNA_END=640 /DNA_ORIENTATION=-